MIDRLSATASIAVRHVGAYADLLASDLHLGSAGLRRQLMALAALALGAVFAGALACVWLIALTWDTPLRLWVIGGLTGMALVLAIAGLLRLRTVRSGAAPWLSQTAREWNKDRQLLEELLARGGAEEA
jgi:uncharacterized membrane protein YqjE